MCIITNLPALTLIFLQKAIPLESHLVSDTADHSFYHEYNQAGYRLWGVGNRSTVNSNIILLQLPD